MISVVSQHVIGFTCHNESMLIGLFLFRQRQFADERKSADVRGAGTRDEPLRTSAWEAMGNEIDAWVLPVTRSYRVSMELETIDKILYENIYFSIITPFSKKIRSFVPSIPNTPQTQKFLFSNFVKCWRKELTHFTRIGRHFELLVNAPKMYGNPTTNDFCLVTDSF